MIPTVATCGQLRPQTAVESLAGLIRPRRSCVAHCPVKTVNRGHCHEASPERCRGRRGDSDRRAGFGASVHDIGLTFQRGDIRSDGPSGCANACGPSAAKTGSQVPGDEITRGRVGHIRADFWEQCGQRSRIGWNCSGFRPALNRWLRRRAPLALALRQICSPMSQSRAAAAIFRRPRTGRCRMHRVLPSRD